MDYLLVALICAMIAGVLVSIKLRLRWSRGRPGFEYQRVFTAAAAGLLFLVTGLVGWTMSRHDAFVAGTRWANGPILWQVGVGVAFLLLAGFWAKRVPPSPARRQRS